KKLLVLAQNPDLAETIRGGVNPEQYRVLHRSSVEEAEPLLAQGLADACIVEVELTSVQGIWLIEKLRRRAPKCPIIIFTEAKEGTWEEEAYLRGVSHVLAKPVRPRMLNAVLERLWATPAPRPIPSSSTSFFQPGAKPVEPMPARVPATSQTLGVLRDFSAILTHSLNAEAMLKEFLLLLREILSINRAAIFLLLPFASFAGLA